MASTNDTVKQPRKSALRLLLIVLILCSCITAVGCVISAFGLHYLRENFQVTSSSDPGQMFRGTISDPIPAEVVSIEAAGETWQGHNIHLQIGYSKDSYVEEFLSRHNYLEVSCDRLIYYLEPEETSLKRLPNWREDIDKAPYPECYQALGISNPWTSLGSSYVLIDRENYNIFVNEMGI